ncbi:MAG: Phosphonoacetaldehyde hydrolase [Bacteroidota bacterium]|jgi:phosphonatase-like hydrolase
MNHPKLIVFDLSGTTVYDDNAVAKCLCNAANYHGLDVSVEEFEKTIGTNKIHLYEFMLARKNGKDVSINDLEKIRFSEFHKEALVIFDYYSELMVSYYQQEVQAMPGAEDVFEWCHQHGIKVATDTGFHRDVSKAIMHGLGWLAEAKIDLHLDVEDTSGIGRPAPYMIHKAMYTLGIQSVHEVMKIGDTPADLLSGYNAGCKWNIGVLSGANSKETLQKYPHTHIIDSVKDLPDLIKTF